MINLWRNVLFARSFDDHLFNLLLFNFFFCFNSTFAITNFFFISFRHFHFRKLATISTFFLFDVHHRFFRFLFFFIIFFTSPAPPQVVLLQLIKDRLKELVDLLLGGLPLCLTTLTFSGAVIIF
ncbi:hypothetical protein TYRP_019775 [Tyrophagus putrescentiae]|nr:hypothetical protein TYRP_019775 [Tyrophagus putrescentiae]